LLHGYGKDSNKEEGLYCDGKLFENPNQIKLYDHETDFIAHKINFELYQLKEEQA